MSDKFTITKCPADMSGAWAVTYPDGFDDVTSGVICDGFTEAVAAFQAAADAQCPTCLKGEVIDTYWGWECKACGANDVAAGFVKP